MSAFHRARWFWLRIVFGVWVDQGWYWENVRPRLQDRAQGRAIFTRCALGATAVSVLVGAPVAWALEARGPRGSWPFPLLGAALGLLVATAWSAVRAVYLAFMLALMLVPYSRRRYRLLLHAHVRDGFSELLRSTTLWLPAQWLPYGLATVGLLSCATAALWIVALLHGERRDEFIVAAPLTLLAVLLRRGGDVAGNGGLPTLGSVLRGSHNPQALDARPDRSGGD